MNFTAEQQKELVEKLVAQGYCVTLHKPGFISISQYTNVPIIHNAEYNVYMFSNDSNLPTYILTHNHPTPDNATFIVGDNVHIIAGNNCVIKSGNNCTFTTGDNCTFITGDNCKFDIGEHCLINGKYNSTIKTLGSSVCIGGRINYHLDSSENIYYIDDKGKFFWETIQEAKINEIQQEIEQHKTKIKELEDSIQKIN